MAETREAPPAVHYSDNKGDTGPRVIESPDIQPAEEGKTDA
jgi:hypothetical protein